MKQQITFYLPESCFPAPIWEKSWKEKAPFPAEAIIPPIFSAQNWIYQTWLLLNEAGVECELTSQMPQQGIVIALNSSLEVFEEWHRPIPPNVFFVDIVTQRFVHPAAHFHLVQNKKRAHFLPDSLFVPHWPQPHLLARDPDRGDRFENAYFVGQTYQCHREIFSLEWIQEVRRRAGIYLEMPPVEFWHDYRHADVSIALRNAAALHHFNKPATKLYNAWHAGIPFIGGKESGYLSEGTVEKNYLQANSASELLAQLIRLKEDVALRKKLVEQGSAAAKRVSTEAILKYWKFLVSEKLPTLAEIFSQHSPRERHLFLMRKKMIRLANRYFAI
ncbi:MAG: hypothetical protein FJ390_04440 [Verrucomicrobia bacterium]|nr:hypothetical protein [Verrucomicrobiota bacterium]